MRRRRITGEWSLVMLCLLLPLGQGTTLGDGSSLQPIKSHGANGGRRGRSLQAGPVLANNTVYDCSLINVQGTFMTLNLTSDLVLSNVTFRHCPAGALSISPASPNTTLSLTILNSTFLNNTARSANTSTTTSLTSSTSSTSGYGAALRLSGRLVARLENCSFTNNTASGGGAAVYSTAGSSGVGSLEIVSCNFTGNRGQGAVAVDGGVLAGISRSNFTRNYGGSALYLSRLALPAAAAPDSDASRVEITQCYFSFNSADGSSGAATSGSSTSSSSATTSTSSSSSSDSGRTGAAVFIDTTFVALRFSDCTFRRNAAMRLGGAIAISGGEQTLTLQSVTLSDNYAGLYGGAVSVSSTSTVKATGCSFTNNSAAQGGAILVTTMSSLELTSCNLTANYASKFGGAISLTAGGDMTLIRSTLQRNQAAFAGAVECYSCNTLTSTGSSFLENVAGSSGGALVVYTASGIVSLTNTTFRANTAATNVSTFTSTDCSRSSSGAGGAVCASITVAMSLANNTFDSNSATSGGALFVTRQCEIQADDSTCKSATLTLSEDNRLTSNTAVGGAGGGVYVLNVSAIAIACSETNADGSGGGSKTVSYAGSQLSTWPYGASGCSSTWYGNSATAGGYGDGLATGLAGLREAAGQGDSRDDVGSNSAVAIVLQMYDNLGTTITSGTYEASGSTVAVWLDPATNLTRYLSGGYSVTTEDGVANFSSFRLRAPPQTYNLSFYALPVGTSDRALYEWAKLTLVIRPCQLGERADSSGEECITCAGPDTFTFSAANATCDSCPADAACNYSAPSGGRGYLLPADGYWHSSPFSPQMHECPTSDACTYSGGTTERPYDRTYTLGLFQEGNLSVYDTSLPTPNASVLYDISYYWQLQCGAGYTGRLCAQCLAPEYGWRSSGGCYECPPRALNTLFYVLSYLLTVALLGWTVRATLGRSLGESRALLRAVRSTGRLLSNRRREGAGAGDDGDNEEDVIVGGEAGYGSGGGGDVSRRAASGSGGGGSFLFVDGGGEDRSGSGRRGSASGGAGGGGGGGFEFSRRSGTFSGGGAGSKRGSFSKEGSGPLRSGGGSRAGTISGSGALDGGGGPSRKVSAAGGGAGGILEMAAAAAMAQLEAEAARKTGRDEYDDDDCYGGGGSGGYGDGYGYANGGGGGFGGRLSGGAFAGALVVDPSAGSAAPLPPAVLPGMRPNIRSRVPRSVLARESRLANSSSAAAVATAVGGGGGGGGDAILVPRISEGSDGSDGEQSATRRHRLSRMSRAADAAAVEGGGGGRSSGSGGGAGRSGGESRKSSGGVAAAAAASAFSGPIAEAMSPVGGRSANGGLGDAGGAGASGAAWSDGLRRRKPGETDAERAAGDGGSGAGANLSRRGGVSWGRTGTGNRDGGGGSSGSWLDPVSSLRRQSTALLQQLKEDEVLREEKPPYAVVLKIMVNFLQVTSVARNLNLDYPSFLDEAWNVGSMASSAMTGFVSIDCSFPSNGLSKAIQRTVLYVSVPWIFILLSLPIWCVLYGLHVRRRRKALPALASLPPSPSAAAVGWGRGGGGAAAAAAASPATTPREVTEVVSFRKISAEKEAALIRSAVTSPRGSGGSGASGGAASPGIEEVAEVVTAVRSGPATFGSYMATRVTVTALIIIFYFYPSVTDSILSIYQCEQLDEEEGAYAGYLRSIGYFWELDFDLRCFSGAHLALTAVVAVPGLVGWCVGVPAGSAAWLRRNAARGRLNEQQFSDRYGFLYEDYRRTAYYWESVIMARKLLVVGLLLVTNSTQDIMQVLAVMGVVVVAGVLQLYFRPYDQDRFNSLECLSLGSTLLVLYLCCIFLMDDLGESSKQAVSVLILVVYVATLAWFVYCMAVEAWRYGVRVLDADGDGRVTRGEVRVWLGLTLGGPMSRIVAFVAAPRWRRRRRRGSSGGGGGGGGGGSRHGSASAAAGSVRSSKNALAPPPLVIVGQTSPPLSPGPFSGPFASSPPPPPPPLQFVPGPTAPPTQLKLPPPSLLSPSLPSSEQQEPEPEPASQSSPLKSPKISVVAPADPSAVQAAGEPVYESYTAVMEMRASPEPSPTVSASPSPPAGPTAAGSTAAPGSGGAAGGVYGARRPSGSLFTEPPTANGRRGPSTDTLGGGGGGDHLVDIESGALPGSTASAVTATAALLAALGSLPGSPLEREEEAEQRDGAGAAGRGTSSASLGAAPAPAAPSASASAPAAALEPPRRGFRPGAGGSRGDSGSGEGGGGGGGGDGPRTTAALALASRPGSPTGGAAATAGSSSSSIDASGRVPSR